MTRHAGGTRMPSIPVELKKQISIFVPLSDWKAIRHEAARLRIPITELCRRWMQSDLERLRQRLAVR